MVWRGWPLCKQQLWEAFNLALICFLISLEYELAFFYWVLTWFGKQESGRENNNSLVSMSLPSLFSFSDTHAWKTSVTRQCTLPKRAKQTRKPWQKQSNSSKTSTTYRTSWTLSEFMFLKFILGSQLFWNTASFLFSILNVPLCVTVLWIPKEMALLDLSFHSPVAEGLEPDLALNGSFLEFPLGVYQRQIRHCPVLENQQTLPSAGGMLGMICFLLMMQTLFLQGWF